MNTLVGVMEAPGKLPLIKELHGEGGGISNVLPSAESVELSEPKLWPPTGKWMDTNCRKKARWGQLSMGIAKAKQALGFTMCHFVPTVFLEHAGATYILDGN